MRVLLLLLLAAPLFAVEYKTLDLRTTEGPTNYYVVFASRGGGQAGHAFVVWGMEDNRRRRSSVEALGLYPVNDSDQCSSAIRTVPGHVVSELFNHSVQGIDRELIVRVDAGAFRRSRQVARQWDCRHEFSILSRDCVEFVRAVGKSLELNMPSRSIAHCTPQGYVRALLDSVTDGRNAEVRDHGIAYRSF